MKFALASTLFATAAAFAPVQNANVNSALNAFANGYVGNEGPEPMPFAPGGTSIDFDPCGFAERAPEWVPWFREAELKHGRAAMLATWIRGSRIRTCSR